MLFRDLLFFLCDQSIWQLFWQFGDSYLKVYWSFSSSSVYSKLQPHKISKFSKFYLISTLHNDTKTAQGLDSFYKLNEKEVPLPNASSSVEISNTQPPITSDDEILEPSEENFKYSYWYTNSDITKVFIIIKFRDTTRYQKY